MSSGGSTFTAEWDLARILDLLSPEEALELMSGQPASADRHATPGSSVAQKAGS